MTRISIVTSLYRGEKYLADFFQQIKQQTIFLDCELVLVHNDPTDTELQLVSVFAKEHPSQIQHIIVEYEPLARSWNRGWQAAQSDVISIWNVDDCREVDSLEKQVLTIESGQGVFCYGDYIEVANYGQKAGTRRYTPSFNQKHFSRGFAGGGAFMVFQRSLDEQIGYFDESLKTASDFDFSLRVTIAGLMMCKVEGVLGYFTNAGEGLSTRDDLSVIERTVLQQRYAIYDKVRWQYIKQTKPYALDSFEVLGEQQNLLTFLPMLAIFRRQRKYLWVLGAVRKVLRDLFRGLGILKLIYWLQTRFIRREI